MFRATMMMMMIMMTTMMILIITVIIVVRAPFSGTSRQRRPHYRLWVCGQMRSEEAISARSQTLFFQEIAIRIPCYEACLVEFLDGLVCVV